jgi:hypothetical protein
MSEGPGGGACNAILVLLWKEFALTREQNCLVVQFAVNARWNASAEAAEHLLFAENMALIFFPNH